jgi:hypothetical protein
MERLFERCAALDVHQASVSACVDIVRIPIGRMPMGRTRWATPSAC